MVRELTKIEAVKLLARLCKEDAKMLAGVAESLSVSDRSTFSVAEIYRLYEQVMRQGVDSDLAKPIVKRDQHRIGF
jgi:hypothetical protein